MNINNMAEQNKEKSFGEKASEVVNGIFNVLTPSNLVGATINQIQQDSKNGFLGDIWQGNRGIAEYREEGEEASNIETAINGVIDILAPLPNGAAKIAALKKSALAAKALGKTLPIASIAKGMAQGQGTYEVIKAGSKAVGLDDETANRIALGGSMLVHPFARGASDQLARRVFRNASNKATPYLNKYFDSRVIFSNNLKKTLFAGAAENVLGGNIIDSGLAFATGDTSGGLIAKALGLNPFVGDILSTGLQGKLANRVMRRSGKYIYSESRGASDPVIGQLQLLNGQTALNNIEEKQAHALSNMFSPTTLSFFRTADQKFKKIFGKELHLSELVEDYEDSLMNAPEIKTKKFTKNDIDVPIVGEYVRALGNIPYYISVLSNPKTYFKKLDIIGKAKNEVSKQINQIEKKKVAVQKWSDEKIINKELKKLDSKLKPLTELSEKLNQMEEAMVISKNFSRSYTELTGERLENLSGETSKARRLVNALLYGYSPFRTVDPNRGPLAKKIEDFFIKYGGGYNSTILSGFRQSVKALNYGKRAFKESPIDEAYLRTTSYGKDTGSFFWGKTSGLNLFEQMARVVIDPRAFDPKFKIKGWKDRVQTGREVRVKSNLPDMVEDVLKNGKILTRDGQLIDISKDGKLNIDDFLTHTKYNERAQAGHPVKDYGYKFTTSDGKQERLVLDTQLGHNSPLGLYMDESGKVHYVTNDINGHMDLDVVYNGKRYTLTIDVGGIGSGGGGGKSEVGFQKLVRGLADDSADFTIVNIDISGGRERFERQFYNGHVQKAAKQFEEKIKAQEEELLKLKEYTIPKKREKVEKRNHNLLELEEKLHAETDPLKKSKIQAQIDHIYYESQTRGNEVDSLLKAEAEAKRISKILEKNKEEYRALLGRIEASEKFPINRAARELIEPHLFEKIGDELEEKKGSLSNKNLLPVEQLEYFDKSKMSSDEYTKRKVTGYVDENGEFKEGLNTQLYMRKVGELLSKEGNIRQKQHAVAVLSGSVDQNIKSETKTLESLEKKLKSINEGKLPKKKKSKETSEKTLEEQLQEAKEATEKKIQKQKEKIKNLEEVKKDISQKKEALDNNQDVIISEGEALRLFFLAKGQGKTFNVFKLHGGKLQKIIELKQGGLINKLSKPKNWEEYQKQNRIK